MKKLILPALTIMAAITSLYADTPEWAKKIPEQFNIKKINRITIPETTPRTILISTNDGLFKSDDNGITYTDIFTSSSTGKRNVLCAAIAGDTLLAGTEEGLYLSTAGSSWERSQTGLKGNVFNCLASSGKEIIYVSDTELIYRSTDHGRSWKKIPFPALKTAQNNQTDSSDDSKDTDSASSWNITALESASQEGQEHLIAGTKNGIFIYPGSFKTNEFRHIPSSAGMHVSAISHANTGAIIFSADNRLYRLNITEETINELPVSSQYYMIKDLFFDHLTSRFFLLDTEGIKEIYLQHTLSPNSERERTVNDKILKLLEDTPSIQQLRQAAVEYADVSPEKIKSWRKKASARALLPALSVSCDYSQGDNYEIYTSATKDYVVKGPDKKSRGWDIRLAWDLADLVYNDAQTSIDTRSRLTVELRNDILEDLNRIYFERKRLILKCSSGANGLSRQAKEEMMLKIDELTARIDALTDGYLTDHINRSSIRQ